jgi:glycine/D-amino acid oxidase-like deaminating enzyme
MKLIIAGAGVVGAACAYEASGLGAEVVLVDADLPGRATAAGAGIMCPWVSHEDDEAWYAFACAAARQYPALIDELADSGAGDRHWPGCVRPHAWPAGWRGRCTDCPRR